MLQHHTVPVTPFAQNCSIVWCDPTMDGAVIDPGGDLPQILAASAQRGVTLKQIWLTHAHIDHAGGTAALSRQLGLPVVGPHPDDQFWIDALAQQAKMFGFPAAEPFKPTRWLHDGDTVKAIVEIFPGYFVKTSIRLLGIDTCEMTSKIADNHNLALSARTRLIQLVTGSDDCCIGAKSKKKEIVACLEDSVFMVYCNFHGMDKYGRALGDLRSNPDGVSFGTILVQEKLALPYDGGTKCPETRQVSRMTE